MRRIDINYNVACIEIGVRERYAALLTAGAGLIEEAWRQLDETSDKHQLNQDDLDVLEDATENVRWIVHQLLEPNEEEQ